MIDENCGEFRGLPKRIGRRKLIQLGGLGVFGLSLTDLLAAR